MPTEIKPYYDPSIGAKVFKLRIDPEFRDLLGALNDDDHLALADSIAEEGCRDALVAWPQPEGDAILLDGHHRHAICEKMGAAYRVVESPDTVTDRKTALAWIFENQRARRNMTREQMRYLSAKVYGADKSDKLENLRRGKDSPKCQNDTSEEEDSASKVAREFGVSRRTILRNAKFAEQVDAIAAEHGPEAKVEILAGRKKVADYSPPPEPPADAVPPVAPESAPARVEEPASESPPAPAPEPSSRPDFRAMTDSQCVDWMAANLRPNGPSGAVAKPIPMPEGASENIADPEVAARGDNPFIFALCQMETQATRAELGLRNIPPPPEARPALQRRLAGLSAALETLSRTLEELP